MDCFGSDAEIVECLFKFLAHQTSTSECTLLSNSISPFSDSFRQRAYAAQSNVTLSQTTAPLLTDSQFDLRSMIRLEYVGDSQNLEEQEVAVKRVLQLGLQLRAFRFQWNTGKMETFLDVTKCSKITKYTPNIRYLQLMNV